MCIYVVVLAGMELVFFMLSSVEVCAENRVDNIGMFLLLLSRA